MIVLMLLLASFIYFIRIPILNLTGYCWDEQRYMSLEEKMAKAELA
jgi:hypothetical protein